MPAHCGRSPWGGAGATAVLGCWRAEAVARHRHGGQCTTGGTSLAALSDRNGAALVRQQLHSVQFELLRLHTRGAARNERRWQPKEAAEGRTEPISPVEHETVAIQWLV